MLHIYHFSVTGFKFRSYLQTFLKEYPYHAAKLRFFFDLNKFFGLFFFFNNWLSVGGGLLGATHQKTNWRQKPFEAFSTPLSPSCEEGVLIPLPSPRPYHKGEGCSWRRYSSARVLVSQRSLCPTGWLEVLTQQSCDCLTPAGRL